MPSRLNEIDLNDFRGGLNLYADAFQLAPSESPDMLNVNIDPLGGFFSRNGWVRINSTDITVATWDPSMLHLHELSDGTYNMYLTNRSDDVYFSSNDGLTWTTKAITPAADPHGVDMAEWGDTIYYCAGWTQTSGKFDSSGTKTTIVQAEAATWSPTTAPVTAFPWCQVVASHQGYMFAANTEEDGTNHPSRLRWSHPNDPEGWAELDYIDVLAGGGRITALVPMGDHLLVFKESAVWALFGYDSDSWQLVEVSREVGAIHRQAVTRNEGQVFFYSHPHGVYAIQPGQTPVEISQNLRPVFDGSDFVTSLTDDIWLGWIDRRLWVSLPYNESATATGAETVFVFDPNLGAWTKYRSALDEALGPYASGGHAGDAGAEIGVCRCGPNMVNVLGTTDAEDNLGGTSLAFDTYYRTGWVNGGLSTRKKRWRRSDVVVKQRPEAYDLTVYVYYDYEEGEVERDHVIAVPAGGGGGVYGSFEWGDGTDYGAETRGSSVERGGNLGSARAVQLRIKGEAGKPWGVDALTLKAIPRRPR